MHGSSRQSPPRLASKGGAPSAAGPADAAEITRLLQPVVSAAGMDLENIRITATGRRRLLRVMVDADGGVTLDDITLISRALSAELDANGAMGETPYTLEVSSPGVDRPDRKSTRLNSSHRCISYAVFCLKKTSELQSPMYIVCRLLLGMNAPNPAPTY